MKILYGTPNAKINMKRLLCVTVWIKEVKDWTLVLVDLLPMCT